MPFPSERAVPATHKALRSALNLTSLLSDPSHNPKVAKSQKQDVLTAPLHLAPADLSGWNVCPQATAGCRAACLHTAGAPQYMAGKRASRIARTRAYFQHRESFLAMLVLEIKAHVRRAARRNMLPAIRLNATSDIAWERVPVSLNGERFANIMDAFPDVQFYDYTKVTKRAVAFGRGELPRNYHLTFSLAENNESDALAVLASGGNVAVVFDTQWNRWDTQIKRPLPKGYVIGGVLWPVQDGDLTDYRPADRKGSIIGLRAKGAAIGDRSGFVRQTGLFRVARAA